MQNAPRAIAVTSGSRKSGVIASRWCGGGPVRLISLLLCYHTHCLGASTRMGYLLPDAHKTKELSVSDYVLYIYITQIPPQRLQSALPSHFIPLHGPPHSPSPPMPPAKPLPYPCHSERSEELPSPRTSPRAASQLPLSSLSVPKILTSSPPTRKKATPALCHSIRSQPLYEPRITAPAHFPLATLPNSALIRSASLSSPPPPASAYCWPPGCRQSHSTGPPPIRRPYPFKLLPLLLDTAPSSMIYPLHTLASLYARSSIHLPRCQLYPATGNHSERVLL